MVIDVRKIGVDSALMVTDSASLLLLRTLLSFIYLDMICTPSEFAMVSRIIGIEVLIIAKLNIYFPVIKYIQPIKPFIARREDARFFSTASLLFLSKS